MSDGTVFFLLLLIAVAVAGWLGYLVGDDHGWRFCKRAWKRAIVESNAENARLLQNQADSREAVDAYLSAQRERNRRLRHEEGI